MPARVTYDQQAIDALVKRVGNRLNRKARDAEVDFPSLAKVKERKGMQVRGGLLRQRLAQALTVPGVDRRVKAPVRITRPKVTQAQLADKYPVLLVADRTNFKLRLYKQLQLVKEYTVAVGAIGFDTPAGLYHIQNKEVEPDLERPEQRLGRRPGGHVDPGGCPTTRSRRAGWASSTAPASTAPTRPTRSARRLARLHPDGDPGRDRALRPGSGRRADLHRLGRQTPISGIGTSSQPRSSRRFLRPVCRKQSVPMKTPRSRLRRTAYHIVEASSGPWIGCQGRSRLFELVDQPGLGQLTARRHPSVLRVDEEDTHSARG